MVKSWHVNNFYLCVYNSSGVSQSGRLVYIQYEGKFPHYIRILGYSEISMHVHLNVISIIDSDKNELIQGRHFSCLGTFT